ncbi:SurA N-terminal domain-containing protein [Sediminibacterium sp.]|uniref:SurA N-terminal domain-containing protein n=1 Tax=Sediminibacterium sp. TaxID=1917865 RepID=UPI0025E90FEC|nr:SurA N-terminal domain-containing protein [Sediminibacterium sp.]MBW0176772.1 peptidylprolyl isomerase [Sediminibacterium sp.]
MSVIQRIRDKGAWIVFAIIALALIAFILQDGVGRGGSAFSNSSVIGKVNGEKIERLDFESKLAMQERMYGSQGAQRDQLIGALWMQEVERLVLTQEYNKLGLQVSPKELSDILFGPNSPLRQEFTDPNTGEFKVAEARQAFNQLKKSTNKEQVEMINKAYIEPTIEQTLRSKYLALLQQASYVPKWLVEKQQADNNAIANISYVYMPYAAVSDSAVKVTDADIAAYVKKHSKEYQKEEETRSINYVYFNASPSGADTLNTLNQLMSLREEFATTDNVSAFLTKAGTELPYYDSYFSKARMQQPNKDSITRTPVGTLYGPYQDGSNFTIAKMIAVKNWPDSAKVRHILVSTFNPQTNQVIRPDTLAKKLIDSIETAVKGGADFAALCSKYSDDGNKNTGGVYEYFPQGQMVVPFNDFSFDKPVGSKGVVKTEYGYHYVEVLGQKNFNPAYKIAYLSKPILASSETVSAASTAAAQFASASKGKKEFDATSLKSNLTVLTAADIKQNDFNVNGIGQSRQLVRWVYENKTGDVSEPIEVGDRYVVAIVSGINPAGTMSPADARPLVEGFVRNEKKAKQILDGKFKGASLEAISAAIGSPVLRADSLSFSTPFLPNVGSEPKIVGAAFNKSLQGKVSAPIAGLTGVFAVKVESNSARPGVMDAETIKQTLMQGSRVAVFRGVQSLKTAAVVKDNRFKFY